MFPGLTTRLSFGTKAAATSIDADKDVIALTGTTAIATIIPKVANRAGMAQLLFLIPTGGAVATTTAGNIAVVQSMGNNLVTCLVWHPTLAKWYPHALA